MEKVGFFKSIHFKFVVVYILLIIIAMQVIGVLFMERQEDKLKGNFTKNVDENADMIEVNLEGELEKIIKDTEKEESYQNLTSLIRDLSYSDMDRLLVVNLDQQIIAASDESLVGRKTSDNMISISQALLGSPTNDIFQKKVGDQLVRTYVVAKPIQTPSGQVLGALYIEASIEEIYELSRTLNEILANATIIALAITALLGIILARTITRPLADMQKQAQVMARGDFTRKVRVYDRDEIGQLAASFNDLTNKLQEANEITESERTKLRSVLSYMTDGVIATDREGYIILMNDRAEEMLSLSRHEAMGLFLPEILGLEQDFSIDQLEESPSSLILDYSSKEVPFIIRASFSVIQKDDGPVNGMITVLHDVTEQEQIEKERREFVSNVSHELRTPLTTMRSYLEALAEGAWQDENLAPKFLNVTQTETERMIRLVTDLLQLSKMDNKDYQLNFRKVNLTEMMQQVIDRFEMSKSEKISFEKHLYNKPLPVRIDPDKIIQVLDNIISNALKYSPDGGKVTFNLIKEATNVHISIKDEGVGIPKQNLTKIFERFYRVDKARSREIGGTGLGLAIASEVVKAHNGEIWAESEFGKGTTIHVKLPTHQTREERV
ncbi:cell wall metabolism sensor histidine kinase WalK [Pseudalkalibacillus salsuginis]|uniref:cell wall metabolism sensor histidine kinase WalK n=1 Tax=Pseudalkalibacillus salsuginis TaxID=2910972 RepID=UPI001F48E502|nr:cell wall metabolism sensor histidine kinase WalK [Pseudalkalibacillus salsuginis]MCF6410734.1 cell wall metabolism sensor histidine kinase WalK [Pseudalkalibacillus salsuginis]